MNKNQVFFRFLAIILTGCIVALFLLNRIGKPIERFEAGIYQKISGKKPQYILYDSSGVPVVVYEDKLGKQYNPVTIAEHAIKLYDATDSVDTRVYNSCINWLTNNYTILNDSSIIFLDYFDWSKYKMTSPWRSAMNQGRAMQAFITAFNKTGDSIYLNYARKSMNALYTEVKDGGVTYMDRNGYWYEEYADDDAPQSRVLNGMIVVLQGLIDFYNLTGDPGASFLFLEGVKSVENTLHLYDNNGHSYYDILKKPTSPWYHQFHIELLDFLYIESSSPIFHDYKQKWLQYEEPGYLVALIRNPTRIGIFAVFTIIIGVIMIISIIGYYSWYRKSGVE